MYESDDIKKTVGFNIKNLRNLLNLTQEQLAEKINIEPNSIAQIESGRNFISCETLSYLSKYFKVSPSFFFKKNIDILNKDNTDFIDEIKYLLPTLSKERLDDIYKIILLFQK